MTDTPPRPSEQPDSGDPSPPQPPAYPMYPMYPYPPPPEPRMPGLTRTAVVMLWILFGLGICGGIGTLAAIALVPSHVEPTVLEAGGGPVMIFASLLQTLVWIVLRGVFAVRISQRVNTARVGAIALEIIGLVLTLVLTVIMLAAFVDRPGGGSWTFNIGASMVLPVIIVCFLMSDSSKHWCDR